MNEYWPHNYVYFSVFPHVPRFWLDFFLLFCQLFDASKAYFFPNIANIFYYFQWESGPNYLDNNIAIYGNLPQSLFFFKSIWLSRVLVVALEIFIVSCGIFCWGTWILSLWCRLSNCELGLTCHIVYGILFPRPGIVPMSPALQVRFLTTGPPGKSLPLSF